jgi:hypothetical protein
MAGEKKVVMKYRLFIVVGLGLICGCAEENKQPSGLRERQEKALEDPFNYSPHDRTDVSGGGMMELKEDAFKKDVDSVFNP